MKGSPAAHVYKALWIAKDIFCTTKSILETRPIYHKRELDPLHNGNSLFYLVPAKTPHRTALILSGYSGQ
jgi:hypothetical protein